MRLSLLLPLSLALAACGSQPAPAAVDAGPADAGPCSPTAQTGCPADQKCSIRLDNGQPTCAAKGSGAAYAPCSSDTDCGAGTICLAAPPQAGFDSSQSCRPFCDPTTQAHLACALGGLCELRDTQLSTVGFCAKEAADGGSADGG